LVELCYHDSSGGEGAQILVRKIEERLKFVFVAARARTAAAWKKRRVKFCATRRARSRSSVRSGNRDRNMFRGIGLKKARKSRNSADFASKHRNSSHDRSRYARDFGIYAIMIATEAMMAQILVRNLEDQVKGRLQHRAKRHGRSMEEEAREILRNALKEEEAPRRRLGSRLWRSFRAGNRLKEGRDSRVRGYPVEPISFDE